MVIEWKDIPGYEGKYQVSNTGKVKSLEFCNNQTRFKREKMMSLIDHGNGYLYVSLKKDNKRRNFYVHRLVAEAFCPKRRGNYVNHLDYNRSNNNADNLEWCTQKENIQWSKERMRRPRPVSTSMTGEKYIYHRHGKYRLSMTRFHVDKTFWTMDEAKEYRRKVMEENAEYFAKA